MPAELRDGWRLPHDGFDKPTLPGVSATHLILCIWCSPPHEFKPSEPRPRTPLEPLGAVSHGACPQALLRFEQEQEVRS